MDPIMVNQEAKSNVCRRLQQGGWSAWEVKGGRETTEMKDNEGPGGHLSADSGRQGVKTRHLCERALIGVILRRKPEWI